MKRLEADIGSKISIFAAIWRLQCANCGAFTFDSSRCLNCHSNFPAHAHLHGWHSSANRGAQVLSREQRDKGKASMINVESIASSPDIAPMYLDFFELGMMYASGRDVALDLVEAHKWFNIAASRGNADATRLRREIAEQMSDAEIGIAQRAARDWLKANPQAPAPEEIRAAA
ncbi:MAG: hypothetical protein ACR2K5_09830 [Pseudolabrys sp.]